MVPGILCCFKLLLILRPIPNASFSMELFPDISLLGKINHSFPFQICFASVEYVLFDFMLNF